jgi:hypothetical protein
MDVMSRPTDPQLMAAAGRLPDDETGLFLVGRDAAERFDKAIADDNPKAAAAARVDYDATLWKLNGATNFGVQDGAASPGERMAEFCKAPNGAPFGWCQQGAFIVEAEGVRAVLTSRGGFFLGGLRAWHIIDLDKPFFSDTGFMSFLNAPIIWGATLEQAAPIWLRSIISKERKLARVKSDAFAIRKPTDWSHLSPARISACAKTHLPPTGYALFPV